MQEFHGSNSRWLGWDGFGGLSGWVEVASGDHSLFLHCKLDDGIWQGYHYQTSPLSCPLCSMDDPTCEIYDRFYNKMRLDEKS